MTTTFPKLEFEGLSFKHTYKWQWAKKRGRLIKNRWTTVLNMKTGVGYISQISHSESFQACYCDRIGNSLCQPLQKHARQHAERGPMRKLACRGKQIFTSLAESEGCGQMVETLSLPFMSKFLSFIHLVDFMLFQYLFLLSIRCSSIRTYLD